MVEDDADIRETMVDLLRERGYDAIGAANGALAIAMLGDAAALPCVILLDMMMPVMNGEMFRAAQLANPAWASIPVVVMSAYHDASDQARVLGLDCLTKPIGIAALVGAIERNCARR